MTESESDSELLLACQQGDEGAWERLVRRYQRLVYAIPRRAGLSDDQAAEVFQQTFATLVEKIGGIERPDRIGAWLATTARRESWRVGRRAAVVQRLTDEDDDEAPQLVSADPLPDEELLRLEEQQMIRVALEALDERCRTLLRLLFYRPDPPAYSEVALAMGTSQGSIGPTRARCLEKLRRLLEVGA